MKTSPRVSVCSPSIRPEGLAITKKCLERQTFQDFEWLVEIGHGRHDLNAAYNRMIRRAQGEIFVSLQDFIMVPNNYLEKWVAAYDPKTFFTAPVGKTLHEDYSGETRWDWRAYKIDESANVRVCKSDCWEIDNGMAPMAALKDVGGFDEELDQWWSWDNASVGVRAEMLGYEVKCLFDNPGIAFDHDAFMPHPFRDQARPALVKLRFEGYKDNPRLNYL